MEKNPLKPLYRMLLAMLVILALSLAGLSGTQGQSAESFLAGWVTMFALVLGWTLVMTHMADSLKKKLADKIGSLEGAVNIQTQDKLIERKYAENASLQLVELSLASDCGEVLELDKRFLELAIQHRARAFHEMHLQVVEATKNGFDPDSPAYRERDDAVKKARSAYWALADKLQKTCDREKKERWREDLPPDLKDYAWSLNDGRIVPVR